MSKTASNIISVLNILFVIFFSAILSLCFMDSRNIYPVMLETIPLAFVLFFSLLANIIIKVKHHSHTPEGELLPLLFLFLSLECSSVLPFFYTCSKIMVLNPLVMNVIIRFSFISTSLLFVFSSLMYMGSNFKQLVNYLIISLCFSFLLSVLAPGSNSSDASSINFGSVYDVYLNYAIYMINVVSIISFIVAIINDKTRRNLKRCITYILLVIGNAGIFLSSATLVNVIIFPLIFAIASIMLIITSKESL
ncbi:MAG TPA: hypothetical protein IAB12_02960 [Candidatus Ornithospirochaeta avicola]|uniref:Uncharacterized protein n=1 Tax=Candidatus Ornithospirochaeta avicola TaxID=2840896 RepID=A0A9D1PT35_9SPIO|nr:hypothetical protein [Candidatus Ornithospirochaeta avicola]